jgi:APA family basic amino acid/polyamine antiporter
VDGFARIGSRADRRVCRRSDELHRSRGSLSDIAKPAIAITAVVAAAAVNIVGAGISSTTLKILTAFKVGVLLFIIAFSFLGGRGDLANFSPFFAVPEDIFGALAGGLVGAFFAFAGWWELSRLAGEIREPEKKLPKALGAGVIILTVIYIGTSAAFTYLVPTSGITNDETFAAQAGEALFGSAGGNVFATVVVISILGTLVAYLMASPRVYYAMARDGIFFEAVARLHPRFNTPHRAILIQVLLASILILAGDFQQIISYFFFVVVLFIAMTVAALFVLRRGEFAVIRRRSIPLPDIVSCDNCDRLSFIGMRDPARTLLGVAVVLIGLPVYYLVFRNKGGTTDGLDQNNPA